jgi:hypothetical protein
MPIPLSIVNINIRRYEMPKPKELPTVKIVDEQSVDVPMELIASHIARLAEVGNYLRASRLKERVIVLLLRDLTGLSLVDIEKVLKALPRLREFLK